jgi:hypothetical protein
MSTRTDDSHGYVANALIGDPTIRMSIVKPVSDVEMTVELSSGHVTIDWVASDDDIADNDFVGYKIYRATSLDGEFSLVHTVSGQGQTTSWTDTSPDGEYVYMVRAIKDTTVEDFDSYENASTGVFATEVIFTGTTGNDAIYVQNPATLGSPDYVVGIWEDTSNAGSPDLELDARVLNSITFNAGNGNDTFTVAPGQFVSIPLGGYSFNGGLTATDTLVVIGTLGPDDVTVDNGLVELNGEITYANIDVLVFDGKLGDDDLDVTSGHPSTITVQLPESQEFDDLTIASGRKVEMLADGSHVLVVQTLSLAGGMSPTATLEMNNNDLVVSNSDYSTISGWVGYSYHAGAWDRGGIRSQNAASFDPSATSLGVITGAQFLSSHPSTAFDGVTVSNSSSFLIVKFTYFGDLDLDGDVDSADSSLRNTSPYNQWYVGDTDYDGDVDGTDLLRWSAGNSSYNVHGAL